MSRRHDHERGGSGLLRRSFLLSYFSPIHHRWSRWAVVGLMLLFFGRRDRRTGRNAAGGPGS
jgi:hypothetical protein